MTQKDKKSAPGRMRADRGAKRNIDTAGKIGFPGRQVKEKTMLILRERSIRVDTDVYKANLDPHNITGPKNARAYLVGLALDTAADREIFVALHLNARNQPVGHEVVSIGSLVHPREIFKAAILSNSAGVILVHNHPSGDATPSREDIELTRRMVKAGEILGIEVLDHIIVAGDRFLSMKETGLF